MQGSMCCEEFLYCPLKSTGSIGTAMARYDAWIEYKQLPMARK